MKERTRLFAECKVSNACQFMNLFERLHVPKIIKNQKSWFDWTEFLEKPQALAIKNALKESTPAEVYNFSTGDVNFFNAGSGLVLRESFFHKHPNYMNFLIELCKFAKIKGIIKLHDCDVRDIYRED